MPPEDEKTFTQIEVNSLLAKERRGLEAKLGEAETAKSEAAKRITELEHASAKLQAERDVAVTAQETVAATHAAEVETLKTAHQATMGELRGATAKGRLKQVLIATDKVFATATHVACELFEKLTVVEHDDAGNLTGVTYNGVRHEDPTKAAVAFLDAHPFLAKGLTGGAGTKQPTGGGINSTTARPMTPIEKIESGLRPPTPARIEPKK